MPLGSASSFAITGYWFNDEDIDFKPAFQKLMVVQAIFTGLVWAIFNMVMKEKPDFPPS